MDSLKDSPPRLTWVVGGSWMPSFTLARRGAAGVLAAGAGLWLGQRPATAAAGAGAAGSGGSAPVPPLPGPLIAIGGGGVPPAILEAIVALVGIQDFATVVLPQASANRTKSGLAATAMWLGAGAGKVVVLDPIESDRDRVAAAAALEAADLLWLPGGSQTQLETALTDAGLAEVIRQRNRNGLVVAGTSAGAAVMSGAMLSGAPEAGLHVAGAFTPYRGLGLWAAAIIDQHFTERSRQGRLLTAVIDRPELLGVGIDERTAVIVQGERLAVVGEGNVSVYDARAVTMFGVEPGRRQAASGLRVSVLRAGQEFDWASTATVQHASKL